MAVKDGLPSTDFSRMNREWVKSVAEGGSGAGLPPVTEADNGKILGVVNGAWGAMDAGGGGDSDFDTATITLNLTPPEGVTLTLYDLGGVKVPFCGFFYTPDGGLGVLSSENNVITVPLGKDEDSGTLQFRFESFDGNDDEFNLYLPDGTVTLSGAIEEISAVENPYYLVTGDCSITCNVALDQ